MGPVLIEFYEYSRDSVSKVQMGEVNVFRI